MNSNPKVQIFLLCRDRIEFARETIDSIIDQDYANYELIISDNSEKNDVFEFVSENYSNIKLVRRRPSLFWIDHFNAALEESSSDFLVIFHDDDVMEKNYLSTLVAYLQKYPQLSAIAPNALVIKGTQYTQKVFAKGLDKLIFHKKPESIFHHYMNFKRRFHAPFPGYLYKKECIKDLKFMLSEGGRNTDVAFLMKLSKVAPILWIPDKLIKYRNHQNAYRHDYNFQGKQRLLRFALSNTYLNKHDDDIINFKLILYLRYLKVNISNIIVGRKKRVFILLKFVIYNILIKPTNFYKMLYIYFNEK